MRRLAAAVIYLLGGLGAAHAAGAVTVAVDPSALPQLHAAVVGNASVQADCPQVVGIDTQGNATFASGSPAPSTQCLNDISAAVSAFVPPPTTLQIVSTLTPALNGTYAIDPATQAKAQSVSIYILSNNKFPAKLVALPWPDVNGTTHRFPTPTQFQAFASAIADLVTAIALNQSLPMQPVSIP